MNFAKFRTHAIPYVISSNIIPISMLYFKLSSLTCPVMPGGGGGQWACLELTEPLKVVAGVVGEYFSDQVF